MRGTVVSDRTVPCVRVCVVIIVIVVVVIIIVIINPVQTDLAKR